LERVKEGTMKQTKDVRADLLASYRDVIRQALAQARESGRSVFIRDVLDDDMPAKTAMATWAFALVEENAWGGQIRCGHRVVGKPAHSEIAEICMEIWPHDEKGWIEAPRAEPGGQTASA
jgi:hypothetical protein